MSRLNTFCSAGILLFGLQSAMICNGAEEVFQSAGFARAPEGALDIAHAPAPLFRDSVTDGAADPSVVWNAKEKAWYIFYTQRRANMEMSGNESWYMGTKIAFAKSSDQGRTWNYVGTAQGVSRGMQAETFWAPHVFEDNGTYHMFVTFIPKVVKSAKGQPEIAHFISKDLLTWEYSDTADVKSDDIIDPGVVKLRDGRWLMVFRDCRKQNRTAKVVSTDLKNWTRLNELSGDGHHEAPVVLFWKNKFWLFIDEWKGIGVYASDDGINYTRNSLILDKAGTRADDGYWGSHPGVALAGDRAFIFYHVHAGRRIGVDTLALDQKGIDYKRTSLQVAELELKENKIICDRDQYKPQEVNVPLDASSKVLYDPRATSDMDDLATSEQTAQFVASLKTDWTLFAEDRSHSIRRHTGLPKRWLADLPSHTGCFRGTAQPGEFYVFQLGVFAARNATGPLAVRYENLPGARCFNLGGSDLMGKTFAKTVTVEKGRLQPLWFGVEVPKNARKPIQGKIVVTADGVSQEVDVVLNVAGVVLDDHGDRDSWRLSRLRWLDSTLGLDDNVVTRPFIPITRDGRTLKILGRELELGKDGLPAQMRSFFNASNSAITRRPARELVSAPFRFIVETADGVITFKPAKLTFVRELKGVVEWQVDAKAEGLQLKVSGLMEYDGFADMKCCLTASRPVQVKDIRLEVDVSSGADTYFMGLGHPGGASPQAVEWKWNAKVNQDGFWIGAVNGGFKLQLYGANWQMPLVNAYYHWRELIIPESWGTGGVRLNKNEAGTKIVAYSGPRELAADQPTAFNFKLFLTPFKPLNTEEQWSLRYLHKGQGVEDEDYRDLKRVKAMGANVINIHHNKEQNPTINYPYFDVSLPLLKTCVADAHANNIKTKIYYTTREITGNLPELFAFWSLNGEIICPSPGKDGKNARPVTNSKGPHPWLLDHLGDTGYIPAWREVLEGRYNKMLDLAVITTPDSRLDNFYCAGLAFTLRETDFDGLYIDDTALGRKGFQRAHRIFEAAGKSLLVDMHSWNHNNVHAGNTSTAYLFMQNFPYYHRLWLGEGYNCNAPLDQMLVQQSGIPFGLMSEMLDHANPWHGMVFGETARLGWSGDPRSMWKFWDAFGMAGTTMIGFWDAACPIKSGREDIPVTIYRKPGKALVAIGSWSAKEETVQLLIDWRALGLDPAKATLSAPAIAGFQEEAALQAGAAIPIPAGKGRLLVLTE